RVGDAGVRIVGHRAPEHEQPAIPDGAEERHRKHRRDDDESPAKRLRRSLSGDCLGEREDARTGTLAHRPLDFPLTMSESIHRIPAEESAGYDPAAIERKWQERWESQGTNHTDLDRGAAPFYALMMFPYPSAEGLHVGNLFAFTGNDI